MVAAEAGAAAYGNVFVHRHGDLSLVGVADLVEDAVRVIPAEEIAIADLVFEVGGLQGAVADAAGAVIVDVYKRQSQKRSRSRERAYSGSAEA